MTKYWNLYVLRHTDAPEPPPHEFRSPAEIEELEARWRLHRWHAQPDDVERVKAACGAAVFDGVPLAFAPDAG